MSLRDSIKYYSNLLDKNKISINGAAHHRLMVLQKKQFKIDRERYR